MCCAAPMCRHSWVLAMRSWCCAVTELCGHHKTWIESGLVSLPTGQRLTALLPGLCTATPGRQLGPCQSLQSPLLSTRKSWEGAVCLLQVGQSPSRLGMGGCRADGQTTALATSPAAPKPSLLPHMRAMCVQLGWPRAGCSLPGGRGPWERPAVLGRGGKGRGFGAQFPGRTLGLCPPLGCLACGWLCSPPRSPLMSTEEWHQQTVMVP